MEIIHLIRNKFRAIGYKIRAFRFYYFFKTTCILIGKNLIIRGGNGVHSFGDNLLIYDNVIFECFAKSAKIETGVNCIFSYGVILSCSNNIKLGDNVWVGEYSSIRDRTHQFSILKPLSQTDDKIIPIKIGNNVWVGKNSLILPGSIIGNNVIIAAGSVIKGECLSNSLYAGNPAIFIKKLII